METEENSKRTKYNSINNRAVIGTGQQQQQQQALHQHSFQERKIVQSKYLTLAEQAQSTNTSNFFKNKEQSQSLNNNLKMKEKFASINNNNNQDKSVRASIDSSPLKIVQKSTRTNYDLNASNQKMTLPNISRNINIEQKANPNLSNQINDYSVSQIEPVPSISPIRQNVNLTSMENKFNSNFNMSAVMHGKQSNETFKKIIVQGGVKQQNQDKDKSPGSSSISHSLHRSRKSQPRTDFRNFKGLNQKSIKDILLENMIQYENLKQTQNVSIQQYLREQRKQSNHSSISQNILNLSQSESKNFKNIDKIEMKEKLMHNDTTGMIEEEEDKNEKSQKELYMSSTPSILSSDQEKEEQEYYGKNSLNDYRKKYLISDKILQKNQINGRTTKDPLVQYLNNVDRKGILPRGMGFVHRRENIKEVSLKSFYLRDDYIDAFSKGINVAQVIEEVNFRNVGLTTNRALKILDHLQKDRILQLDLSYNSNISKAFYQTLSEYLDDPSTNLRRLILEGNKIGDSTLSMICKSLLQNNKVNYINFNNNEITDHGFMDIIKLLQHNETINVIFINWNRILGKGGAKLAQVLSKNRSVQILDISFNALGGAGLHGTVEEIEKAQTTYANKWKECFEQNTTLLHVDISHNNFNQKEIDIFSEGLNNNHTILGIHIGGNQGQTDAQGFVKPTKEVKMSKSHILTRISPVMNSGIVKNSRLLELKANSNCWICEGWSEVRFEYKPGVSDENPNHDKFVPIYLHLQCDNYEQDLMLPDQVDPTLYVSTRMIPPGLQTYYFSIGGEKIVAKDQNNHLVKYDPGQISRLQSEIQEVDIEKTNYIDNVIQIRKLYDIEQIQQMVCKPRLQKLALLRQKVKTPWDFFKSVFKDYKPDNAAHLNKCFEFDYSCSKIARLIKDVKDSENTKEFLRSKYKLLRETYKYYAGVDPIANLFCIGTNTFTDVVNNCFGLLDSKTLKLSDIDLEFVSTKAGKKSGNNPERQLVRYNFMEIFVRLAITKFVKTGICQTICEALEKLFNDHLQPYFQKFDSHKFRQDSLWCEECDLVFKRSLNAVKTLYSKFSGKYALPGAPRYMSLEEFITLVTMSGVVDDKFGEREISPLYNLAMMTQVDEIDSDRHLNMVLVEFIEAIGRIADKLDIPNLLYESENEENNGEMQGLDGMINANNKTTDFIPPPTKSSTNRLNKPLFYKIEAYIIIMVKNCLGPSYYDTYIKQLKKTKENEKGVTIKVSDSKYR